MVASILAAIARIKSDVAQFLQAEAIEDICRQIGYTWRERALGPVATIHAFLLQVLHGNTACDHVPHLRSEDTGDHPWLAAALPAKPMPKRESASPWSCSIDC